MLPEYEFRNLPIQILKMDQVNEFPTKFHKHVEICLVLEGELEAEIEDERRCLKKGDIYLVFPNIPHAVFDSPASVLIAIVDAEIFSSYHEVLSRQKPKNPFLSAIAIDPNIQPLFRQIYNCYGSDSPYRSTVLHSLLNALIGILLISCQTIPRNSENELIERILIYFSENYTKRITLDDIAQALNYSKYYISHIINDTLHCNFSTLINSYRISLAQNLLLSSGKTVGDIAKECGFQNQSSFNRVFAKLVGIAPCEFRSSKIQNQIN